MEMHSSIHVIDTTIAQHVIACQTRIPQQYLKNNANATQIKTKWKFSLSIDGFAVIQLLKR